MQDDDVLLAIKEAAGELSVSRDTVSRYIDNGELEAIVFPKAGGTGKNRMRRVRRSEVRRFKERRATKRKPN